MKATGASVVLCSAGDQYGTVDVFNESKSHFVSKMMGWLDYDAVGVGEMDLGFGIDGLVEDVRQFKLNVTCANIVALRGREPVAAETPVSKAGLRAARRAGTVFPPYLIVQRNGIRVGFLALLSPSIPMAATDSATVESRTWGIRDPMAAAAQLVPELRRQCDVLVLLAHMEQTEAEAILDERPDIDFCVLGHARDPAPMSQPLKVNRALVLKATTQGQFIGQLSLSVNGGEIGKSQNQLHLLDKKIADQPQALRMLDEFDEENRQVQKVLYAREQLRQSQDDGSGSGRYLGVGSCQGCHVEQFSVYTKTAHAHAYATLAAQFVHRDTNCVGCHVTGYGEPGGFSGFRSRTAQVDLVDVQCESCHGPGNEHARDGSYRTRAITSCVRCHTKDEDPEFDFAADWPKIRH